MYYLETLSTLSFVTLIWTSLVFFFLLVVFTLETRRNYPHTSLATVGGTRHLSGPIGIPLVGHLPMLGARPFLTMTNWRSKYGDIYKIRMGSRDTVILNSLQAQRTAFLSQSQVFAGRPDFYSWQALIKCGSLTFATYSEAWRLHHKIAVKAFSRLTGNSSAMEKLLLEEAEDLISVFLDEASDKPAYLHDHILQATSAAVFNVTFGQHNRPSNSKPAKDLLEAMTTLQNHISTTNVVDMMPWLKTPMRRAMMTYEAICDTVLSHNKHLVEEHQKEYHPGLVRDVTDAFIEVCDTTTETTWAEHGLQKDKVLLSVLDFIGAGIDTTTNLLHWIILYMAKYPAVQSRVYHEIHDVLGNRHPRNMDQESLAYTYSTLMEICRHVSPTPLSLPHSTTKDTILNGYRIAEGTMVFGNYYAVNHDAEIWGDPEKFRPDRFLTQDDPIITRKSLVEQVMLFGLGKRRCLGEILGRMEMFLFFVLMIQRCEFINPPENPLDLSQGKLSLTWQSLPQKILVKHRK